MIALALALPLLAGCQLNAECDPTIEDCGGTDGGSVYTGDLGFSQIAWSCCDPAIHDGCDEGGLFWYDLVTDGRAATAVLSIVEGTEAGGYTETHELPVHDDDPDGWWEDRYLELAIADSSDCASLSDCEDLQKANENTLFPCSLAYTRGLMTWSLRLYESAGGSSVECAAWGQDAESVADCDVWDLGS